ncbi:FAD-dependent oxidoreductase [Streptomyces diastatochromogenes]|nr:FAD-dependent oxidoreductase [Streptomyces diastatochromogenes]
MTERPHLAVVGAGPAGLAGALAAAARGVRVTLVDAAEQAGGQFYRQPAAALGARRPRPCTTSGAPGNGCGTDSNGTSTPGGSPT